MTIWKIFRGLGSQTLILASFALCASAQSDRLADAVHPLTDGVPQVAIVRLRSLLEAELPLAERNAAKLKLGEALVADDQPKEALKILEEPTLRDLPGSKFCRAQALAALARWEEARVLYQQSAADPQTPFPTESLYGQAQAFRALGRIDQAIATLQLLERRDPGWRDRVQMEIAGLLIQKGDEKGAMRIVQSIAPAALSGKKERRFLRARLEARLSRKNAIELYDSILKSQAGTPHSVLIATLIGIAHAHLQSHTPEAGDNFLEEFIERHPADPDLPTLFAKLDQLYAAQGKPSYQELTRWSNEAPQPRRAFAQWYLARGFVRAGQAEKAHAVFALLRTNHPALPVLAEALLDFAQLELRERRIDQAVTILEEALALQPSPPLRARSEMLLGSSLYAAGKYDSGAQIFRRLADSTPAAASAALFNATLGWMQAGDAAQAEATSQDLRNRGADEQTRGDLRLEGALLQASRNEKEAAESLQKFIREFPKHTRASEALVALAELAFHAAPPHLVGAQRYLAQAAASSPTSAATERADYLMIWLEDAAVEPNEAKVIALAEKFLRERSASPFAADVRLKLAEMHYRRQDFASARTQFEILAQGDAASPLVEKALFFAAKSAAQTMGMESLDRALILFDEVVKKNGELKWAARNEQAVIERKLDKPQDAVTLYDEVLQGDAPAAEKREALCAKGDIAYEQGAIDPENYRRAITLYEQLAAESDAGAHWRNQALFKKGMCLEKLKEPAQALATFYRIVDEETRPDREREFFWYYKAGFNAARLLEEESKWEPAAAVYEKLAFAGGARSEEAKSRLNQLRLEHFLWER